VDGWRTAIKDFGRQEMKIVAMVEVEVAHSDKTFAVTEGIGIGVG